VMGGKKKYIEMFGSFMEPFIQLFVNNVLCCISERLQNTLSELQHKLIFHRKKVVKNINYRLNYTDCVYCKGPSNGVTK